MSSKQKFWCACGTIQFYFEELNFLSHTDESFKDKTRVCGCNFEENDLTKPTVHSAKLF